MASLDPSGPSLATMLRESIERWAQALRDTSSLSLLVQQQKLTQNALAFYLESLRYLFHNSERNQVIAMQRAEQLGDAQLVEYFIRRVDEERGHDGWAISDLAHLPREIAAAQRPAQAICELIELQKELIAQHPLCFVAYVLWAEYFTVLLGDDWLDALAACGFPRAQVSAIDKHLDADREHARRGFEEIDRLWRGEPQAEVMLQGVRRAERLFDAFADEICAQSRHVA